MTNEGVVLVLVSALLHAWWNFLLKQAAGSQVVLAMSKVAEAVLFAPVFIAVALPPLHTVPQVALLTSVAAAGVLLNYASLGEAYRHGDLSLVYPVSRGAALVFLPIFGAIVFGEGLSGPQVVALLAIVAGILILPLPDFTRGSWKRLRLLAVSPAARYALLAALVAALYTIWDKRAVRLMNPFGYMYLYTCLVAAAYGWWLQTRVLVEERHREWRKHRRAIVSIGILNTASYLLTLLALRTGVSTVVIGLRQVSIAAGVALGWLLLRESRSAPRVAGVALILSGCLALSLT